MLTTFTWLQQVSLGPLCIFYKRGVILIVCVIFLYVVFLYFTQRCNINSSVCDSIVCDLYFTQRCVINRVCDSFVCGSVGPNPHALSALTMSTQEPIFYRGDTELFRYRIEIFRAVRESLTMAVTPCFWNCSITLGI